MDKSTRIFEEKKETRIWKHDAFNFKERKHLPEETQPD
jgi:hypothetical protein